MNTDRKRKVLIVEDDGVYRNLYADLLTREGYSVVQALNGKEGMTRAECDQPDLILLDLMMPVVSGLDMLESLQRQEITKHIPVLILSARGQQTDIQKCLEFGAKDYAVKGYHKPKEILAKIQSIFNDAKSQAVTYRLFISDSKGDAIKFLRDTKLSGSYECPQCRMTMALELTTARFHDQNQEFAVRLVCPLCAKPL